MTVTRNDQTGTDRVLAALSTNTRNPRKNGTGWVARCPNPTHGKGRGDRNASLSVTAGDDGDALVHCHGGCHTEDVVAALGLAMTDLFTDNGDRETGGRVYPLRTFTPSVDTSGHETVTEEPTERWTPRPEGWTPPPAPTGPECTDSACTAARAKETQNTACVARYVYEDIEGVPVGVVHRWDPKSFRPFTPSDDGTRWRMGGTVPFPYGFTRMIEVFRNGGTVMIVEGEKDADTINALGRPDLAATTNAGGAGKWTRAHTEAVHGAGASNGTVIVCGDNDDAGMKHTTVVADHFADSGREVLVVWPTKGKDITEHLQNGGTLDLGTANGLRDNRYPGLGPIYTMSDLDALPPIRPLIDGWLSTPSAAVLIGGYGLGKSALTLSMGCSIATGSPFLGVDTEPQRVLYVVGEGVRGLSMRRRAWSQTWGRDVPDDMITVMGKTRDSLRDAKTWRTLRAYAQAEGYGFVILDTFSSLAPDADEVKDVPLIMAGLNEMAEAINGTALLVHHPGWSQTTQDRARGGYQIEGNADEVLVMTAPTEGADHVAVKVKKRKDGESGRVHYLRRLTVPILGPNGAPLIDEWGKPVTSVTMEHARADDTAVPMRERVLAHLAQAGEIGSTPREIASDIGVDHGAGGYKKVLNALKSEGLIRSEGRTTSTRYFLIEG